MFITLLFMILTTNLAQGQQLCPNLCNTTGLKTIHINYNLSTRNTVPTGRGLPNYNQLIHIEPSNKGDDEYYAVTMNDGTKIKGDGHRYNFQMNFIDGVNSDKLGIQFADIVERDCICLDYIITVETCLLTENDDGNGGNNPTDFCRENYPVNKDVPILQKGKIADINMKLEHLKLTNLQIDSLNEIIGGKRICRILLVE